MFNSSGNRGNIAGRGNVLPFEVLGKWMGRYAMWQLDFANDLFIDKVGTLGATEICYDVNTEIWDYKPENEVDVDDDPYSSEDTDNDDDDSDSELEACISDDDLDVVFIEHSAYGYGMREQPVCIH